MNRTFRWISLAPCVVASWMLVLVFFAYSYKRLTSDCNSASLPKCSEAWYLVLEKYLPAVGTAVSAFVVVAIAYAVAPSGKVTSALLTFLVGSAIAAYIGLRGFFSLEAVSAIGAGLITTVVLACHRGSR
jgi:hypothetical protein